MGGSPDGAVEHLRRALAEPPPVETVSAVLGELGTAEAAIHDPAAIGHLETALGAIGSPALAMTLAAALGAAGRQVDAVGVLARPWTGATIPVVSARLEAELVAAARRDVRVHHVARERVPRLRERLADVAGLPEERLLRAHLAFDAAARLQAPRSRRSRSPRWPAGSCWPSRGPSPARS